jgi:hypothetical protein
MSEVDKLGSGFTLHLSRQDKSQKVSQYKTYSSAMQTITIIQIRYIVINQHSKNNNNIQLKYDLP